MDELKILSVVSFGYGFERSSFEEGLRWGPDAIVGQGTSADPGPYYFGISHASYLEEVNVKRDLGLILTGARRNHIPFILSNGGPSGNNPQLDWALKIVDSICRDEGMKMRVAVIRGEIPKEFVINKIRGGEKIRRSIETDRLSPTLRIEDVDEAQHIVGQMGPEAIVQGLDADVDGVITGRALDVGLHMALPLKRGFDRGLAAHMGKVIECSALCAEPAENDAVVGFLRKDSFSVRPPNPKRKCTVVSVASHSFYERPDPSREANPGGYLDISQAVYEQTDERTVRVSGSRWIPAPYTVKIEGAKYVGYRTIAIMGIRDPHLIKSVDILAKRVEETTRKKFEGTNFSMLFHVYGRNGVLREHESLRNQLAHELCVILEVVAATKELSAGVCGFARGQFFFGDFPGKTTTAGNVASPFAPHDIKVGEVYEWNVWHLMPLANPSEPFPVEVLDFPRK